MTSEFDLRLKAFVLWASTGRPPLDDSWRAEYNAALSRVWEAAQRSKPTKPIDLGSYMIDGETIRIQQFATLGDGNGFEYSIQTVYKDDFSKWEIVRYPLLDGVPERIEL